ncbi:hypothetical protein [Flagellimonas onchidii]|uniref:hypothetical protein n=1 Tax=Flagellimonas onchidii TaxID=2562684 RepID=UPI001455F2F8|nr:hypothetical protein [Allomuricauda onchidii]
MKLTYFFLIGVVMICSVQAQNNQEIQVQIGDELVLGQPKAASYRHINVPRKNFIIKRGGIANLSSLQNSRVIVTDIVYGAKTQITFKRTNDRKFFRIYKTFTADLENALNNGELVIVKKGVKVQEESS